jgi:diadenosine tetraphosphate (Ap4A) HIT family hydrolase
VRDPDPQPTLLGYCIVAPRRHAEDWVHDLDDPEFLALQHVVRRVAGAVAAVVPTERMYSLSLGSQQGNSRHRPRPGSCPQRRPSCTAAVRI